jgi:hypothetical protein
MILYKNKNHFKNVGGGVVGTSTGSLGNDFYVYETYTKKSHFGGSALSQDPHTQEIRLAISSTYVKP